MSEEKDDWKDATLEAYENKVNGVQVLKFPIKYLQ